MVWKTVNYNGTLYPNYEVNELGEFRNSKTQKVVKQNVLPTGYHSYCASLGQRGKNKCFRIHRAVACTFIPTDDYSLEVNHKNGIKTDNRVKNLEWVTGSENIRHAVKTGLINFRRGVEHKDAKLDWEKVKWIRENAREYGIRKTARKFGVSHTTLLSVLNSETWSRE